MPADRIDSVVSLAKRRGFVFPSSEIYGGTRSAWDYGPLGVELKENVRRQWWKTMVQQRDDIVGLDSAVILARDVWAASGHLDAEKFDVPLWVILSAALAMGAGTHAGGWRMLGILLRVGMRDRAGSRG